MKNTTRCSKLSDNNTALTKFILLFKKLVRIFVLHKKRNDMSKKIAHKLSITAVNAYELEVFIPHLRRLGFSLQGNPKTSNIYHIYEDRKVIMTNLEKIASKSLHTVIMHTPFGSAKKIIDYIRNMMVNNLTTDLKIVNPLKKLPKEIYEPGMTLDTNSMCNLFEKEEYQKFYIDSTQNILEQIDNSPSLSQQLENFYNTTKNDIVAKLLMRDYLISATNFRKLALSNKALTNLKNYKVPTDIRIDVLNSLPNRKDIIQVSDNLCYKYEKNDDYLMLITLYTDKSIDKTEDQLVHMHFLSINLKTNKLFFDHNNTLTNKNILTKDELIEQFYGDFIVCVTYLELTDVTLNTCLRNTKRGNATDDNILDNKLPYDIIQVNTNWNNTIIYIGDSFNVKGHWRLQPYGENRAKFKYIFIDTYEKTGIIKKTAGKELHTA